MNRMKTVRRYQFPLYLVFCTSGICLMWRSIREIKQVRNYPNPEDSFMLFDGMTEDDYPSNLDESPTQLDPKRKRIDPTRRNRRD